MASGILLSAADVALHTSDERANFQRLARLLMCGGLALLRQVFDSIHSPTNLPAVLSHPATVRQLNGARLTRAEWDRLYLPTGGYGTSGDFDITLLFRLLRTVCHLAPPVTGWDSLPCHTDSTLEADLVRIKIYRNTIYGHNQTMEISDAEFVHLWREISDALLRIAGGFGSAKRDEWKESIDKFQHDPLTPDAESYVAELQLWYKKDMDTKDEVEKLRNEVEKLRNEVEQLNIKQEQMNIKQEQMNINIRTIVESITKPGGRSITPWSGHFFNVPQLQEAQLHFGEGMCAPKAIPPKQLQMSSIFACDLGLNGKTLPRNFFCCFVFRFREIFLNQPWRQMRASLILLYGKAKAFFGKDAAAFLHTLFVENERETSKLKYGDMIVCL